MSQRPPVLARFNPTRTYVTMQKNYPGAQAIAGRRGWWAAVPGMASGTADRQRSITLFANWLVVRGTFTAIGGKSRAFGIAAINAATGVVDDAFVPTFTGGNPLGVGTDGTWLYVGGSFTAVNGVSTIAGRAVNGVCRFDSLGALDTTWNPGPNVSPEIGLIVPNNAAGTVFLASNVAGANRLSTIAGTGRNWVAEVSTSGSGALTAWNANPDGAVYSIALDSAGRVYLGGIFTTVQGTGAANLARLTLGTLDTVWAPAANGAVRDMAYFQQENIMLAVGAFTTIGGAVPSTRNRAAFLRLETTAEVTPFNPNLNAEAFACGLLNIADQNPYTLAVLIAGAFTTAQAAPRNRAAYFDFLNGTVREWNPNADAAVNDLIVRDRTAYMAGAFVNMTSSAQRGIAAVPYPIFADTNTLFVSKAGSDANPGTRLSPKLTVTAALNLLGAFGPWHVCILDSAPYRELYTSTPGSPGPGFGGLWALDGQTPSMMRPSGGAAGTYGARASGRTRFSTGAPGTFAYVSIAGNDATAAKGNPSRPFRGPAGALAACVGGDTVQIQDSGYYFGNLNAGGIAVTVQAAQGAVPVIGGQLTGAAGLSVYGLTFFQPSPLVATQALFGNGATVAVDCTFVNYTQAISMGAAQNLTAENCVFEKTASQSILLGPTASTYAAAATIINCVFNSSPTPGASVTPIGAVQVNATAGASVAITNCSFIDPAFSGGGGLYLAGNGAASTITVRGCYFYQSATIRPQLVNGILNGGQSNVVIDACEFAGFGGAAIRDTAISVQYRQILRSYIHDCASGVIVSGTVGTAGNSFAIVDVTITNCATNAVLCTAPGALGITGAMIVNTGSTAIRINMGAGVGTIFAASMTAIKGATGFAVDMTGPPTTPSSYTDCIFEQAITPTPPTTSRLLTSDPLVLDSRAGSENTSVSSLSPCINYTPAPLTFSQNTRAVIGPDVSMLWLNAAYQGTFEVDGITFSGGKNLESGITTRADTLGTRITHCTFTGLARGVVAEDRNTVVENCVFSTYGSGVIATNSRVTVRNSVAASCAGGGIVNCASDTEVSHVTAYGCEYGVFDQGIFAPFALNGNTLSGNGVDYYGAATMYGSAVPIIKGGGAVTGTRLDPLFRNLLAVDLRLQALAVGSAVNSPALGIAPDGTDAGAFDFFYGPVVLSWSLLDCGTGAGNPDTAYRNPDHVSRTVQPLKLAEGETFGGITYSVAPSYKTEHRLEWGGDNSMPIAQVNALIALYTSGDGECQLSFDGGVVWIPVRVLRSESLERTEIEGAFYSDDSLPTPVRSLTFREST